MTIVPLAFGATDLIADVITPLWLSPQRTGPATAQPQLLPMWVDGHLANLQIQQTNPLGNGELLTYTVYKNSEPTSLSVTIASNAKGPVFCRGIIVPFLKNDTIGVVVTKAAPIGNGAFRVTAAMEVDSAAYAADRVAVDIARYNARQARGKGLKTGGGMGKVGPG